MELYWIYFVCVILCVHVDQSSEQSGIPASPCQNMFYYQREGYEWVGLAQVKSLPLGQTTKLEVMLSLRAKLPSVIIFLYRSYYHLVISWIFSIILYLIRSCINQVYFRISQNRLFCHFCAYECVEHVDLPKFYIYFLTKRSISFS